LSVDICSLCENNKYLTAGSCVDTCPAGYKSVGILSVGRKCCLLIFGRSSCD
jgi:hypothetical protein